MNHRTEDVRSTSAALAELGLAELTPELIAADPAADDVLFDGRRLAAVEALGLSDPATVQPVVSDILAGVAERLHAPIALLNVVLTSTQIVAGEHGLSGWLADVRATPVEWSLCARVVRSGSPYVVPDWAEDESTRDNPLLTVDGLRAYAGVPLTSPSGEVVGAVCVIDTTSRDFGPEALDVLSEAASAAMERLVRSTAKQ